MANRRTYPVYLHDDGFVGVVPGDVFDLEGDEARHASTVRRHRDGEVLVIADGAGTWLRGEVEGRSGRDRIQLRVLEVGIEPATRPRITVIQALPKTDRADSAVELLTEVGVDRIAAWQASRCVARWDADRAVRGLARWERTAREAAKQSRRTWTPDLVGPWRTVEAVAAVAAADLAFVLHETAPQPLVAELPPSGDPAEVVIVVGPEGGLTSDEVAALAAAGARVVGLGPTVMRTSTAGAVAVSLVAAATGRLSHLNPLIGEVGTPDDMMSP